MKIKRIYLAGLISTEHPESLQWRTDSEAIQVPSWIELLNPMAFKERLAAVSKDGGLNHPSLTAQDIILRDYKMVRSADVILANLNSYGSKRPILGTWVELGWAWEHHIPVVAFANPATASRELADAHPFVRAMVAHIFDHWSEALTHAAEYYCRA